MRHDKRTFLAVAALCAPSLFAQTQNDAEIACREATVQYARTDRLNVGTDLQANRGGLYVINWQVRDARNTYRGFCEVDRNSRVQRIEQTQGPNLGGNAPAPPPAQGVPQVSVDTSGRGTFGFGGRGAARSQVDRAWVDTRSNRPSISLNVDGRKMTFYGAITERRTDREFEMRIDDSSEGRATGTARFRLNGDRNEVEMVSIDGQLRGNRFDGTFQR